LKGRALDLLEELNQLNPSKKSQKIYIF